VWRRSCNRIAGRPDFATSRTKLWLKKSVTGGVHEGHGPETEWGAHVTDQASFGSALALAHHVGGTTGAAIAHAARTAFMSGMDVGLLTTAAVALVAAMIGLLTLPGKSGSRR
jgi:hypothetical protein